MSAGETKSAPMELRRTRIRDRDRGVRIATPLYSAREGAQAPVKSQRFNGLLLTDSTDLVLGAFDVRSNHCK